MDTQISLLGLLPDEDVAELKKQVELFNDYANQKRKWENAFQKWSNEHGINNINNTEDWGCCGYGSMCDWCKDNSYGRPCIRALNAMCREKGYRIDYEDLDFVKVWRGTWNETN